MNLFTKLSFLAAAALMTAVSFSNSALAKDADLSKMPLSCIPFTVGLAHDQLVDFVRIESENYLALHPKATALKKACEAVALGASGREIHPFRGYWCSKKINEAETNAYICDIVKKVNVTRPAGLNPADCISNMATAIPLDFPLSNCGR